MLIVKIDRHDKLISRNNFNNNFRKAKMFKQQSVRVNMLTTLFILYLISKNFLPLIYVLSKAAGLTRAKRVSTENWKIGDTLFNTHPGVVFLLRANFVFRLYVAVYPRSKFQMNF